MKTVFFLFFITLFVFVSSQEGAEEDGECFGDNEEWSSCYSNCQGTCDEPTIPCPRTPRYPCYPGCVCLDGFLRKYEDGPCIPEDDC